MSSLADSANGTIEADAGDAVEKAVSTKAAAASEGADDDLMRVQAGPQLSEFVLRVADRIADTRNKIRDCKTDIETQKALNRVTSSNGNGGGVGAAAAEGGLDLSDLSSSRAEAKLEEAGTEFVETMLKFDGLVEVMRGSQISEVIENALQGNTESGMQLDDEV